MESNFLNTEKVLMERTSGDGEVAECKVIALETTPQLDWQFDFTLAT